MDREQDFRTSFLEERLFKRGRLICEMHVVLKECSFHGEEA